jgi:peptidoglycan/LPS O-acetylase OafA/YrhL
MSASLAYRPDIDGLRAISVTVVMLFHLGMTTMSGGFVGVDVFFVISGYLITSIIAREVDAGEFTFAGFYERRIRRIYPALMVVLAAAFLGAWVALMPREFLAFARTLIATPLFAANFMFLGEDGYFDAASVTKPLLHIWSLGVEEQFYIVFPWLLIAARRYGRNRLAIVVAVVAASLASSVVAGVLDWGQAYFLLPMRFWELGFGALLALYRPAVPSRLRDVVGVGGAAAIVASCFLIDESMAFPGWVALFPVVGAAAVMVAEGSPANRLLATRPFVFIGRISYPMYLWHWPLIVFTVQVLGRSLRPLEATVIFALTVLLSWGTLALVEAPIRARRWAVSRRSLFVGAAVLSAVFVALGVVGVVKRGWSGRFTPDVEALAAVGTERTLIQELCPHERRMMGKDLPPCILGDAASPRFDFVLLGDSHARAIAGSLAVKARELGLKGLYLGRVACPPLPGADRQGDRTRRCAEHVDWAVAQVRAVDPRTVLVHARWADATSVPRPEGERGDAMSFIVGGRRLGHEANSAVLQDRLGALLDAVGQGRRVALIASVPVLPFDVPTALAADRRFGRPERQGVTRADHERRQAEARRILDALAAEHPGTVVLDPATILCPTERCDIVRGGTPLYNDDNHLGRVGSALLAEPILDFVKGAGR